MLSKSELTPILPLESLDRFWARRWTGPATVGCGRLGAPGEGTLGWPVYAHRLVYRVRPHPDGEPWIICREIEAVPRWPVPSSTVRAAQGLFSNPADFQCHPAPPRLIASEFS